MRSALCLWLSPWEEWSSPVGCLTPAGVLLYHAKGSSASSVASPRSSSSWEHVLFLWMTQLQLDPTFSADQPLTGLLG